MTKKYTPIQLAIGLGLVMCLGFGLTPAPAHAQQPVPRFESAACPFTIPESEKIECGYLIVPEDRSRLDGPTIRIGVAVVKSHSPMPAGDPIIVLNGGPGSRAVELIPGFIPAYAEFLAARDVVFFDQRGVGWSQPALDCPELTPALIDRTMGRDRRLEEQLSAYLACRDRLLSQGVNLAAYNTLENAADVNDLRLALGYRQVNLLGISYGTILAQIVMRDFPEGIRSVVLDSVVPLQVNLVADGEANISRMFETIFANCAADLICRTVYPDLEAVFYRLLDQLNQAAITLSATNPVTGESYAFSFDGAGLIGTLMQTDPRQVPGLIYDLQDGNYDAVLANKRDEFAHVYSGDGAFSAGMRSSVLCSLSQFIVTREQLASAAAAYPEAIPIHRAAEMDFALCENWPAREPNAADQAPVVSNIPTLVLVGEYDPGIPPAYGQMAAATLSRSFFYVIPGAGHVAFNKPCAIHITRSFLNNPTREPDAGCAADLRHTAFVVRAAVMRPPVWIASIALGGGAAWAVGRAGIAARRRRWPLAWRIQARLIGWIPMAASFGALALGVIWELLQRPSDPVLARLIEFVVPLAAGMQAAFLLPLEDEPALEVSLACPRPMTWTLIERLALLLAVHGGIGLAGSLIGVMLAGSGDVPLVIARWLAPMFLVVGFALSASLRSRQAAPGVLVAILMWFAMAFIGETLMERWPSLWPIHAYLEPDAVAPIDYALNRLLLSLAGLNLIVYAARQLRDEERALLGGRRSRVKQT